MSPRIFSERDIHLHLDGELPADEAAAFEAWLAAHPEMQALSQRYAEDRDRLRAALAGVIDEPVPVRLSDRLTTRQRTVPLWLRYAAAAVLLVMGGLAGYFVSEEMQHDRLEQLADSAIDAHVIYAAEKSRAVEVAADQREQLQGWLSARVGVKLAAPDLTAQGYEFLGGRLLPFGKEPAAQFMYQDAAGKRVSIYFTRDETGETTKLDFKGEASARALYWLRNGYGCVITGDLPDDALRAMARATYQQVISQGEG